jgi:phosphatidylinositol glycan class W
MTKSITLAITCVAIMTVDYPPLFPRYLCKTEDYGWSLMDVGVSSVMFTSGMSSRLIVQHKTASRKTPNFMRDLFAAFSTNKLVILAASIRFFLLTGIDYHDHVTEWGVHWNFFMTIAVINVLQVFVRSSKFALLYAFIILLA